MAASPPSTTASLVKYVGNLLVAIAGLIVLLAVLGLYRVPAVEEPGALLRSAIDALSWVALGASALATGGVVARKAPDAAQGLGEAVRSWMGGPAGHRPLQPGDEP